MHFRDRTENVRQGDMIVVPRGVEHKPCAEEETWIVLFEPQAIDHTGGWILPIGEPPSSAFESERQSPHWAVPPKNVLAVWMPVTFGPRSNESLVGRQVDLLTFQHRTAQHGASRQVDDKQFKRFLCHHTI